MKESVNQIENFSALLNAAQKGDQMARDKMGEIYFPLVEKITVRHKYQYFLGEDAVGDGCVAFTIAMDSFAGTEQSAFENYLCKSVYNCLGKAMKNNYRHSQTETTTDVESNSLSNSYSLDVDMEFYLKELHSVLTERQFRIVLMRLEEMSEDEIAKVLKVSSKTVFRELRSIKEKVKGILFCR